MTHNVKKPNSQSTPPNRRFRLRYRQRTLVIFVAVLVPILSVAAYKVQSYLYQKRIADSFANEGAVVEYRYGNVIGINFSRPHDVGSGVSITPDHIRQINKLKYLEWLHFSHTDLSNELLAKLRDLDEVTWLSVDCKNVTSNGIEKLNGFPKLQIISVLLTQLDGDTEAKLRKRYPNLYIEKLHVIDGRRVVDGYQ